MFDGGAPELPIPAEVAEGGKEAVLLTKGDEVEEEAEVYKFVAEPRVELMAMVV